MSATIVGLLVSLLTVTILAVDIDYEGRVRFSYRHRVVAQASGQSRAAAQSALLCLIENWRSEEFERGCLERCYTSGVLERGCLPREIEFRIVDGTCSGTNLCYDLSVVASSESEVLGILDVYARAMQEDVRKLNEADAFRVSYLQHKELRKIQKTLAAGAGEGSETGKQPGGEMDELARRRDDIVRSIEEIRTEISATSRRIDKVAAYPCRRRFKVAENRPASVLDRPGEVVSSKDDLGSWF